MTVRVTFDVLGDTHTVKHTAPKVTYRLRHSGVATIREYDTSGHLLRSVSYRSVWIIDSSGGDQT